MMSTPNGTTPAKTAPAQMRKVPRFLQASDRDLVYRPHKIDEFVENGLPECVALDLETTGFVWSKGDRIIEIGAVRYDAFGREIASVERLINIGEKKIPPVVLELTHITDEMLQDNGIPLEQALDELDELLADNPMIVGHNIQFDLAFLTDAYAALRRPLVDLHAFCTWQEGSKKMMPDAPNQKLDTVAAEMKVELIEAHRAAPDARVGYQAAKVMVERFRSYPKVASGVRKSDVPGPLRDQLRPKLYEWRAEKAKEQGIPAWKVLTNMALESILREVPSKREEFDKLFGITDAQAKATGTELMRMIRSTRTAVVKKYGEWAG